MSCNKIKTLCPNTVVSSSVSLVTVGGVSTLVIDIPATVMRDRECFRLIVAQEIPEAATVSTPVALGIGGVTDPVYPLVRCGCRPVTACAIRTRGIYDVQVSTTTTGANIWVKSGLACAPVNNLRSIPAPAAGGGAGA
jgi:hypothetical protein